MSLADVLALVARIRAVEQRLAVAEQERIATALLNDQIHALGNALQIVDLASGELVRHHVDHDQLLDDLRSGALGARGALAAMVAIARPAPRTGGGAAVAPIVRAAIDALRAVMPAIQLDGTVADTVTTRLAADELDALVLAAALDVATAAHVRFTLGERTIANVRWLELVRHDDRPGAFELDLAPPSLAGVVDKIARLVGGEVSLAPGRDGHELAIALPVAAR
jgi:hypothetical protein